MTLAAAENHVRVQSHPFSALIIILLRTSTTAVSAAVQYCSLYITQLRTDLTIVGAQAKRRWCKPHAKTATAYEQSQHSRRTTTAQPPHDHSTAAAQPQHSHRAAKAEPQHSHS